MLAIRTAVRFRWKTADLVTLLLFGLHSHLVHIPLLFGQLKYQLDRFAGRTRELIEYKENSAPRPTCRELNGSASVGAFDFVDGIKLIALICSAVLCSLT